ncbi:hypothetical protein NQ314_007589 [Rhamnusium bicolor]|uniref:SWIM-type domain-containing protein n=1 Tax=Rhamnusium bicolor TaxID=1586634 RepID=A0AAV8YN46_9CUCU|nr:hypothetical protein NQ314_007589 [Rhamnusium bicolor]
MEGSILQKLAFDTLKDAENIYKHTGTFPNNILENLHSFFGENMVLATELLDKCKIIEYKTENGTRNVFKIATSKEQYTVYENINFCHCEAFRLQVLESRSSLTCKHVLAVKLGQITNQITKEEVTGSQFVDFLNEQLCYVEDNCD